MTDDAELLRHYAEERSEPAFAEFVQRRIGLVYAAALRRTNGDEHRAVEVAQQVFTMVARRASALSRHDALTGWLYAATRNAALNLLRDEQRRRSREHEAQAMNELLAVTAPDADWNQLRPVLDEAIDELNGPDREAVLLRFFEGRAFVDVGAKLRLSENAARMRVERALDKLRGQLARRGITSTSVALGALLANQADAAAPVGLAASVTGAALAGVAGIGGTAAALTFMSTSKTALGLATILAVIGLGSAVYEAKTASRAEAALAALREEHTGTMAGAAALELRLHAAERDASGATEKIVALQRELEATRKTAPSGATRPATTGGNSSFDVWRLPGYARLDLEIYRASLGLHFGPLYRSLNLSTEQIAKFEAALVEKHQGLVDIWTAASAQGLATTGFDSPTATSVVRLTSAPNDALQENLKTVLGEAGLKQYGQFEQATSARELVTALAGNVYYSDPPLTAQQGEALVGILNGNSKTVKTPMADDGKKPIYVFSQSTDWDAVNAQAQALLSASQLAAFRSVVEQKRLESEMKQMLQKAAQTSAGTKSGSNP